MAQEVILMEDVPGLGITGDIVRVAPGYARNYLLPKKLGAEVTGSTRRQVEKRKVIAEAKRAEARVAGEALKAKLASITCSIGAKAGPEGKLFGSIGVGDILAALKKQGVELQKHQVALGEPFRALGSYTVAIKLLHDLQTEINVQVVQE